MPEGDYTLVLPFDNDDPMFVRGVEVGRIWETLKNNPQEFEETVHITNAEMMIRMAEAQERDVWSEELDEVWTVIKFGVG